MVKILCTGDLHIGRLPSALPVDVDASSVSPASVWSDVVELALRERVDLVLLSGDLIDRSNRLFEAFGPLESGIRALTERGIVVVAVAGNHDFDALPRFARTFQSIVDLAEEPDGPVESGFHLLGEGGRWERLTVVKRGRPIVHIDGWSFPKEHVSANPLHEFDRGNFNGQDDLSVPTIGIIHADLGQTESKYAPVTASDLAQAGHAFWLLGHIHKPSYIGESTPCPILYPGSVQPLDPGETGERGPWLVHISEKVNYGSQNRPDFSVEAVHIPMARLTYENLSVDVTGSQSVNDAETYLITAMRQSLTRSIERSGPSLRHLLIRLQLTGRTPAHSKIGETLHEMIKDLELSEGHTKAYPIRLDINTTPDRDLEQIAAGIGAPAILARALLSPKDEATAQLLKKVRQKIVQIRGNRTYAQIPPSKNPFVSKGGSDRVVSGEDQINEWVKQEGLRLLDALLAQKETDASEERRIDDDSRHETRV